MTMKQEVENAWQMYRVLEVAVDRIRQAGPDACEMWSDTFVHPREHLGYATRDKTASLTRAQYDAETRAYRARLSQAAERAAEAYRLASHLGAALASAEWDAGVHVNRVFDATIDRAEWERQS